MRNEAHRILIVVLVPALTATVIVLTVRRVVAWRATPDTRRSWADFIGTAGIVAVSMIPLVYFSAKIVRWMLETRSFVMLAASGALAAALTTWLMWPEPTIRAAREPTPQEIRDGLATIEARVAAAWATLILGPAMLLVLSLVSPPLLVAELVILLWLSALVVSFLVSEFTRCPRCGHLYHPARAPMIRHGRGCHHCGLT